MMRSYCMWFADLATSNQKFWLRLCQNQRCSRGHKARGEGQGHKKKSEAKAKDSLFEDRASRSQGQECSRPRPRTKDTGASVLQKNVFKKFFRQSPIHWRTQNFDWGGLNNKSHAMTSSKIFKTGSFCETKISQNGRSEIVACLHVTRILQR